MDSIYTRENVVNSNTVAVEEMGTTSDQCLSAKESA